MYIYSKKETLVNYLDKSFLQKLLYIGRGLDIAEAVTDYIKADYSSNGLKYNKLVSKLWTNGTKNIKDIFSGREYGSLKLLLGDNYAGIFKEAWDRAPLYSYSVGYLRRSYRSNISTQLYLGRNIDKLIDAYTLPPWISPLTSISVATSPTTRMFQSLRTSYQSSWIKAMPKY